MQLWQSEVDAVLLERLMDGHLQFKPETEGEGCGEPLHS